MTTYDRTFANSEFLTLGISDHPRKPNERDLISPWDVHKATKFYPTNDGEPVHKHIVRDVAKRAAVELVQWVDWLNEQCYDDKVQFILRFDDHNAFDACIVKPVIANSEWREYPIIVGLGCIPVLLSVANILSQLLYDTTFSGYYEFMRYTRIYGPMGMLTYDSIDDGNGFERTTRIALDALILVFLHEATHGCRGHLHFPQTKRPFKHISYQKAMESDADWGAGYMFVKGLLAGLSPRTGHSATTESKELAERLACAIQTNLLGFQSTRKPDESGLVYQAYHLPYTRIRCTVFGAKLAWEKSGTLGVDFFATFYEGLIKLYRSDDLFRSACAGWVGHDEQLTKDDWGIHDYFTLARLAEVHIALAHLEAGPMRSIRMNFPAVIVEPTYATFSPISAPFKLKTLTYRLLEARRK
jgi:hypothetical protein